MKIKIAVTSNDGKQVDCHFGRAKRFSIYEFAAEEFHFVEARETRPACHEGEHDDGLLLDKVNAISDCQIVIVQSIGPGALDLLHSKSIHPVASEQSVTEALDKLRQSLIFRRILTRSSAAAQ
jgi:predicted Fe-Mo cluster-binding NifX family protein